MGHLRGNRFVIKVRQAEPDPLPRARAILDVLARRGVPNYFGEQRFGRRGDNAAVGRAVLRGDFGEAVALVCGRPGPADTGAVRTARTRFDRGDYAGALAAWPPSSGEQRRLCAALRKSGGDAGRAWRALDRKLALLYISALQSDLFNRVLAQRVATLDRLVDGDVAWKHANGASFLVEDAAAEQPRCDAFEISPSGPLFGGKMMAARGGPGQLEARVLGDAGLTVEQLAGHRHVQGARRPLRFKPEDGQAETGTDARGPYVRITFTLASGCYATTVLREICKAGTAGFDS
jgi:tRNA pseudouridine13 synthase